MQGYFAFLISFLLQRRRFSFVALVMRFARPKNLHPFNKQCVYFLFETEEVLIDVGGFQTVM